METYTMRNETGVPAVVDRATFQAELDALRLREKTHTREGDAIAAARRRLPMVEVDATVPLIGRRVNMFYLVCYVRDGDRVFETYWTNGRGVEPLNNSYGLLDMTVYGRQEQWEESPAGWP